MLYVTTFARSSIRRVFIYQSYGAIYYHSDAHHKKCFSSSSLAKEMGSEALSMWHFTYLISVVVFCGLPFIVMLEKRKRMLKRYELVLLTMVGAGTVLAASDYFAVRWGAWYYNPSRTLGVHYITQIETFVFSAAIFLTVATATLISAAMVDSRSRNKSSASAKSYGSSRRSKKPGTKRVLAPFRT